jgi:hypothetical protein
MLLIGYGITVIAFVTPLVTRFPFSNCSKFNRCIISEPECFFSCCVQRPRTQMNGKHLENGNHLDTETTITWTRFDYGFSGSYEGKTVRSLSGSSLQKFCSNTILPVSHHSNPCFWSLVLSLDFPTSNLDYSFIWSVYNLHIIEILWNV